MAENTNSQKKVRFPWKTLFQWDLAVCILLGLYLISVFHVGRHDLREKGIGSTVSRVVRVAHNLSEENVNRAFRELAARYQELHPEVAVHIQSIPLRAYEQWVTTQLMGDTAPDLILLLDRSGTWSNLAQEHLVALSPHVLAPNPYNRDNPHKGTRWRETIVDNMEGGYFLHLMEFYGIPLTLDSARVFYNKDLLKSITGSDQPPENFREMIRMFRQIEAYAEGREETLYPIAVSQTDVRILYDRYFPTLNANMMDRFSPLMWGTPANPIYETFGAKFDYKEPGIRKGFELLKTLAQFFQPSFITDQGAQIRFLFIQGKAVMVIGNTQDQGVYDAYAGFDVGVMEFPEVGYEDPEYGKYYDGPVADSLLATFTFGLTRNSRNQEEALDFMRFCTSVEQNEWFCKRLGWYPAVEHAERAPELEVFRPRVEGVTGYPVLSTGFGSVSLYFEQTLPLYFDGQIDFDTFMDNLKSLVLSHGAEDQKRKIRGWVKNQQLTEFNVARAKAKMLFQEAGTLEAGRLMGHRTPYHLGLEILHLLDHGNTSRLFKIKEYEETGTLTLPEAPKL